MTNKKSGNSFEAFFCEILFSNGFWAHNLAQKQAGQPADVLAVKNGKAFLIDCKVCSGKGFPLSRIEDNQESAMRLWQNCGNGNDTCFFALKFKEQIYMISFEAIKKIGKLEIPGAEIKRLETLERWMRRCEQ